MSSCCTRSGTDRFFSRSAARYAKRFRRKGPDKPSALLVAGLERVGIEKKTVLDVGCGTGDVHLTLLRMGAASAEGIDLSSGMVVQAGLLAKEMGFEDRVRYIQGDFARESAQLSDADVVVLDKVVCCYEFPVELLRIAAAKSAGMLAISFPSASVPARIGFRFMNWLGLLLRWSFHPFYHDPALIRNTVLSSGFVPVSSEQTVIWQIMLFRRADEH